MVTYETACVQVLKKKVRAGKNPRLKLLCNCPSPQRRARCRRCCRCCCDTAAAAVTLDAAAAMVALMMCGAVCCDSAGGGAVLVLHEGARGQALGAKAAVSPSYGTFIWRVP